MRRSAYLLSLHIISGLAGALASPSPLRAEDPKFNRNPK